MGRTDAIIVVRLDPERQRATLLSLPRDLWVPIPAVGQGKLNSAYVIGEQQGQGAAFARDTVASLLGVTIDHTVVVDFAGFRSLVDALGGVTIDVPRELYDPQFPTDDYGYTLAHFTPGPQTMNGQQALMYSRIRHPDSDFERMQRQQLVLVAIANKLRERGTLQSVRQADQLTAALLPFVRSDVPPPMALKLLWSLRSFDVNATRRLMADTSILMPANIGGGFALVGSPDALRGLGTQLEASR